MQIVQFSNGKYGLRKGNWLTGYSYLDLETKYSVYWWRKGSIQFLSCQASADRVAARLSELYPQEVVKENV
jgi:hypothetical protein